MSFGWQNKHDDINIVIFRFSLSQLQIQKDFLNNYFKHKFCVLEADAVVTDTYGICF